MQKNIVPLKRKRTGRILKRISTIVAILLLLSAIAIYSYLWKSKPMVKGEVVLSALKHPVHVWRDPEGVPHIEARDMNDLFRVQGYITAQDRLFQMDLIRRQASGMLSEVLGEKTVPRDRFFRTLGLRRAAEASAALYPKEYREHLEQYARGVNDYIREARNKGKLPIEFSILQYEPTKWTVSDSLVIGKYMSYDLSGHWKEQAFRYHLIHQYPLNRVLDLFPGYPKETPAVVEQLKSVDRTEVPSHFSAMSPTNKLNGSNNWVVSGKRTMSGKPLLANDPHLNFSTPSIWYESHLKCANLDIAGVMVPGIPGVIVGHNAHIAWGVTNVGTDVQDLYLEKRNPNHPDQFLYKGKWETAKVVHEKIRVKKGKDIDLAVQITRHGPVFSEWIPGDIGAPKSTAFSLKWTALEPSAEFQAIFQFSHARHWEDFKKALTHFHSPTLNFVFAATDGTIAYRANGKIPIRKGNGFLPVPGWTGEYEWQGYIPWEELPTTVNPESGVIATANHRVVPDGYKYHVSHNWALPYRHKRIMEVLSQKDKLTVEDMKKLQSDCKNLRSQEFTPYLLQVLTKQQGKLRELDQLALPLLKTWNHVDDKDQGAPLLFHFLMQGIATEIFGGRFSDEMSKLFEGKDQMIDNLLRRERSGKHSPWIQEKGGMSQVILRAYQKAVDQVADLQGNNSRSWRWGKFHQALFPHPFDAVKWLRNVFNPRQFPASGSDVTVSAVSEERHGPSWRTVIDMSRPSQSDNVLSPGQSGHILSIWYDNQIDEWRQGKYHVTSMDPRQYRQAKCKLVFISHAEHAPA